jgi:hypothetical protein
MPLPLNQVEEDRVLFIVIDGGAGGTRTPYLFNAIEALSQLSYSPIMQYRRPQTTCTNIAKLA